MRHVVFLAGMLLFMCQAHAQRLVLPTRNDALFSAKKSDFYQFVDRDFKGVKTTPWEAGQFGFVRDPVETSQGMVYRRFHEGIDIKPISLDEKGEPHDRVCATADGKVVHICPVPGYSNYGQYVVIEHMWEGCRYYSLYAHLREIAVAVGDSVKQSEPIGILGYTGDGIDKRRAHLHFEINLFLSPHFDVWHSRNYPTEMNRHGEFNGMNLAGFDVAEFLVRQKQDPTLTLQKFLQNETVMFKVRFPVSSGLPLLKNYPWMMENPAKIEPVSWEVYFTNTGLPFKAVASTISCVEPELFWIKQSPISYSYLTRRLIQGSGSRFSLAPGGRRLIELLITKE